MRRIIPLVLATLLVAAGVTALVRGRGHRPVAVRAVTAARLLSADTAGDWLTYGHDYANRRYVPFTQIDRQNVTRLAPLWRQGPRRLIKSYLRPESTTIVTDGLLIYTDPGMRLSQPGTHVIAVDLRTGREAWSWYRKPDATALCCGFINRGVAVYGDKVYVGTLDAHLVALDRRTGKVVWDQPVADPGAGYSFTMAPLAVGGKVLIGSSGGEFRIRGFLDAYDAESGRRLWRFWTVPSPEEGGWWGRLATTTPDGDPLPRDTAAERRDSAAHADAWRLGGGPVWTTPAYDPALDLVIFGIGNPSPVDGRTPPGDNLYTTSLAAVELATGRLRWHYQMVPHDVWDYDPASPPLLVDVVRDGARIPAVAEASKTGWVYILDRRTGARLHRSEPFVPHVHTFPAPTAEGVVSAPGTYGGSNWPSAAYLPATGLMYVLGTHVPMRYRIDTAAGLAADSLAARAGQSSPRHVLGVFEQIKDVEKFGTFTAVDVSTGKIRWQRRTPGRLSYGGALATASGLVFFPEPPFLNALDGATGDIVWRYRMGQGDLGPPINYLQDGEQRIAITSTTGVTVFGLRAR